jgi:ribosomal-protein-alanine N-acetyltransferase
MNVVAPVEFFPMEDRDLDAVAAVESRVQRFPWTRELFAGSMQHGHSCWVCRIGGELAGFSVVMPVLDEAHLLNLAIHPGRQGAGLGGRLLRKAMEVAQQNGAVSMFLEVRVSNLRAIRLYNNFGFRRIAERRDYYPAENGRENALVFARNLP